jgi:hypothetical protein
MTYPTPQTTMIERLEQRAGHEGTARARQMTAEHFRACRLQGITPDASRLVVYREALEMVILGLVDEPHAGSQEQLRSYASLYNNPNW